MKIIIALGIIALLIIVILLAYGLSRVSALADKMDEEFFWNMEEEQKARDIPKREGLRIVRSGDSE